MLLDVGDRPRRVAVVGVGGAGKTTFAVELGRRLDLPVVHLDRLYWRPGWDPLPADEWRAAQEALVRAPVWVVDGNYSGTMDIRLAVADTAVFFDVPRRAAFAGVLRRWAAHWGRDVQADGCRERLDPGFLRWLWNWPRESRQRVVDALSRHPHLRGWCDSDPAGRPAASSTASRPAAGRTTP
jgi:adenylate kinase family enzyme